MQAYFHALADDLCAGLTGDERLLLDWDGEVSDFARLNHGRVRQAGSVRRISLGLDLIEGRRHAEARVDLAGTPDLDRPRLQRVIERLREQRRLLPEDPYLHYSTQALDRGEQRPSRLPEREQALEAIVRAGEGLDLVGIWASGTLSAGFASSLGHRLWHETGSFNLDWSCYLARDKAVKARLAGTHWRAEALAARMRRVRDELEVMARPPRSITPGRYRVYLAPEALQEVLDMMAWGGFGLRSHRTGQTPMLAMVTEGRRLDPAVTLREGHAEGLVPGFTPSGFLKPDGVTLIEGGVYRDCLVDPRSAAEYGAVVNAAGEWPESLRMTAGDLAADEAAAALGTGLYVSNLWYLNFSDRARARITGMTRFACFWVEGGRIREPVNVMRFDDSIYHLLGGGLEGLTRERELILDPATYGGRSRASYLLPGALIDGMRFTL